MIVSALKAAASVLAAIALVIAFFGMNSDYERAMRAEPVKARVLEIDGREVSFQVYTPESPWDDDGDGWVGPYASTVPAATAATFSPGQAVTARAGELEAALRPPSAPLMLGGAVGCLFLGAWALLAHFRLQRAFKKAAAAPDPIRLIRLSLVRTRRNKLNAALLWAAMGIPIVLVAFLPDQEVGLIGRGFLVLLGLSTWIIVIPQLRGAAALLRPDRAPVMQALLRTPERIVWVYPHRIVVNGIATNSILLHTASGEQFDFRLQEIDDGPLMAHLQQRLPHAIFGWSHQLEAAWKEDSSRFLGRFQSRVPAP